MRLFKRVLFLFVTVALLFSFLSCSKDSEVHSYLELHIPLGEDFYLTEDKNFDAVYSNGEYVAAILRISFVAAIKEGIPETMTPYEFGKFWIEKCQRSADIKYDEVAYCEYNDSTSGEDYFYLEAFFRSQYAYFVVLFATASEMEDAGRVKFLSWAKDVYFTD